MKELMALVEYMNVSGFETGHLTFGEGVSIKLEVEKLIKSKLEEIKEERMIKQFEQEDFDKRDINQ